MKKYKILTTIIMIIGLIMISRASETKNLTKAVSNLTFAPKQEATVKEQHTICIDPGHQAKGNSQTEQVGPNSGSYKAKVSSGTAGIATKKPEYELNLEASLKLKHILESRGYKVYMTRESHDVDISNKERAIFANEKKVDMVVRIHADGSDNTGITGASILIPSKDGQYTSAIFEDSSNSAKYVNENMVKNGHVLGGEQSGHIIFSKHATTGDGILTSLKVMEAVIESKRTIAQLIEPVTIYPQLMKNVPVRDKKEAQEDPDVRAVIAEVETDLGENGRVLVRESGTEPVVRVMVEADTDEKCLINVNKIVDKMKEKGFVIKR